MMKNKDIWRDGIGCGIGRKKERVKREDKMYRRIKREDKMYRRNRGSDMDRIRRYKGLEKK